MHRRLAPLAVILAFLLSCVIPIGVQGQAPDRNPTLAFSNGQWFDGHGFNKRTAYSVNGVLTFKRPAQIERTIDLHEGFVIPPFAEAHNHNVETLNNVDTLVERYLSHGIFYVKNPNNLARDRVRLLPKLDRPDSIDVSFSNGSFTGSGGHPVEIPQRVIRTGKWTEADAEGGFYYVIDDPSDLEKKWPLLIATHPDFIKTYLLYSNEYARRKNDPKFNAWKGLDPALLPIIVRKAHAEGLRVSAHIENEPDFHNALVAGVDEINHMPGFRYAADVEKHVISDFEISDADAQLAARHDTFVVTTLAGSRYSDKAQQQEQDRLNANNLAMLMKHHVRIALGSDSYRSDTVPEATYIASLHVMSNARLLNFWCSTVQTIFPKRKVGELKDGYEASFLVLSADPTKDFSAIEKIDLRVKQGQILEIPSVQSN